MERPWKLATQIDTAPGINFRRGLPGKYLDNRSQNRGNAAWVGRAWDRIMESNIETQWKSLDI